VGVDAQMLVRTRQAFKPDEVRRMSGDLAAAFGSDSFWIWDDYKNEDGTIGRHALELVNEYQQDGDSIFPEPGETFIEVHLGTRYYGRGYERGDVGLIIHVAAWLEANIHDAKVYYGGDSSGICAKPFDQEARRQLFAYYAKVGHEPYVGGFGRFSGRDEQHPGCDFCLREMTNCGGGGGKTFYHCGGCGKKIIFDHIRKTTQLVPKGKDFFDMREA